MKTILLLLSFTVLVRVGVAQRKLYLVQNVWENELNSYNPTKYWSELFDVFKQNLGVSQIEVAHPLIPYTSNPEVWNKKLAAFISTHKSDSAGYLAIQNELRLPRFNPGKFLFKNPPRSSKLTFRYFVYDTAGRQLFGDTIIHRGCVSTTVDNKRSTSFFYADYQSFIKDMQCHFDVIKEMIYQKTHPKTNRAMLSGKP